jgi:hypothetical protein
MSTWISRTGAALAASLTVLGIPPAVSAEEAPERVAVSSGAVRIAGPRGFCVDLGKSGQQGDAAFVVLGSCAALLGRRSAPAPKLPVVLTASVIVGGLGGQPFPSAFADMEDYFRSAPGRAALSRSGQAGTVTVLEIEPSGETLYLRARDTSPGDGLQQDYWRAVLSLKGRIVTLSALGLAARPVASRDKRRLLEEFVDRVRKENRGP